MSYDIMFWVSEVICGLFPAVALFDKFRVTGNNGFLYFGIIWFLLVLGIGLWFNRPRKSKDGTEVKT